MSEIAESELHYDENEWYTSRLFACFLWITCPDGAAQIASTERSCRADSLFVRGRGDAQDFFAHGHRVFRSGQNLQCTFQRIQFRLADQHTTNIRP